VPGTRKVEYVGFRISVEAGSADEGTQQRKRLLQAVALTPAELDHLTTYIVSYLRDTLENITQGHVHVIQADHEVLVEVHGECSSVLPAVAPVVGKLIEQLSVELSIAFILSHVR
jgi:hypothetical protein